MAALPGELSGCSALHLFSVLGVVMQKISPSLQDYDWGSKSFIQELLGITNADILAEAWYGAHPKAPSLIQDTNLLSMIEQDPHYWLGPNTAKMPFLLKILAANKALSIQVHPNKTQAEQGFAEENQKGIALSDPRRCFRDDNHKPELMMALTDFYALCGFREYAQIIDIFVSLKLTPLFSTFASFSKNPNLQSFSELYLQILQYPEPKELNTALLKLSINGKYAHLISWIKKLNEVYPGDPAIISPLLMNLIKLRPYEAIYLDAGIIHAYLEGSGIEIMASGDNVLRAGLTSKHIDISKLCEIMTFVPFMPEIQAAPSEGKYLHGCQSAAKDFKLYHLSANSEDNALNIQGIKIVLCLSGEIKFSSDESSLKLSRGESAVISASRKELFISGSGTAVIAAVGQ